MINSVIEWDVLTAEALYFLLFEGGGPLGGIGFEFGGAGTGCTEPMRNGS